MRSRIILFGPLPPPYGGVAIYMKALMAQLHSPNVRVWTYGGVNPHDPGIRFIAHRRLGTLWALIAEGRKARILDASHFHLEYPNPCLVPNPMSDVNVKLSRTTEALIKPYLTYSKGVCSIGVFFPSYGFKDVAEAVERLRNRTSEDIGLILLDGGFVRDEQYRNETLRCRDWITVLEKVPNPELYKILKRSDVFVRAFADESYGIARIEAIWCGIPVVATRAGETRGMLLYDFGNE